jgi:hypothetical protein
VPAVLLRGTSTPEKASSTPDPCPQRSASSRSALRLWRGACRDTNLAHFYRALGIALQRRCYRQILGPCSYLSKFADLVVEPDKGEQVRKWLGQSAIRARAKLLELSTKGPSAMHIADPTGFGRTWQVALLGSVSWTALEAKQRAEER